jgi:hypothetical protein
MNNLRQITISFWPVPPTIEFSRYRRNGEYGNRRNTRGYTPTKASQARLERVLAEFVNKGDAEFSWVGRTLFFDV